MKVALINDQLNAGGAEKVLVNMANLLHAKGVDVSVVLFLKPAALDNLINPGITIHYLNRQGRLDLKAMRLLKEVTNTTDIVHVHSRYNLRYLIVAKHLTGITNPRIVFHEHVPVLSIDKFTKYCFNRSKAYVAVLKSMCEWAEKEQSVPASKVFYLPNTVNAPTKTIEQRGVGTNILMVGNFWNFKNQLFAINLINSLPAEFTLDMYGGVNDKEYHQQLVGLTKSQGLEKRVRLIEGVNNIYSVIGNYNFAIHTSPHETGPLVLLEYMHAGLPFITYNTGDVVDNLKEQLPETVIDSFEIEEWTKRIDTVMMNDNARSVMRGKMKNIIEKNYTEESYWQKLQSIYKAVLN